MVAANFEYLLGSGVVVVTDLILPAPEAIPARPASSFDQAPAEVMPAAVPDLHD